MGAQNHVAVYRPGPVRWLWDALGFGQRYPEYDDLEKDPRFAEGAIIQVITLEVDWADRLRLLVSGKAVVRTRIYTDVPIKLAVTRSAFGVSRPGGDK